MKLYNYWRSSSSWRVRIALALKNLPYDYVAVDLAHEGNEGESYDVINPQHQVPALVIEAADLHASALRQASHALAATTPVVLTQSIAICDFLDAAWPEPRLTPAEALIAARVRQLSEIINAGIQPLQNMRVVRRLGQLAPGFDGEAWIREWIARGLDALERLAVGSAGRFLVGEAVTLADVFLVPQLRNARLVGTDLGAYPTLLRTEAACAELPAFIAAAPERQPDAPTSAR